MIKMATVRIVFWGRTVQHNSLRLWQSIKIIFAFPLHWCYGNVQQGSLFDGNASPREFFNVTLDRGNALIILRPYPRNNSVSSLSLREYKAFPIPWRDVFSTNAIRRASNFLRTLCARSRMLPPLYYVFLYIPKSYVALSVRMVFTDMIPLSLPSLHPIPGVRYCLGCYLATKNWTVFDEEWSKSSTTCSRFPGTRLRRLSTTHRHCDTAFRLDFISLFMGRTIGEVLLHGTAAVL